MAGATNRDTFVLGANAANFNQAANTVLFTFTARKSAVIHRFGAIADAATGLLAAMVLKLRIVPQATGVAADLAGTTLNGAVKARGFGIVKSLEQRHSITAGDEVTIAVSTDAGAASTGDVWIEFAEESFVVAELSQYAEST